MNSNMDPVLENNRAVHLLKKGSYDESVATLAGALQTIRTIMCGGEIPAVPPPPQQMPKDQDDSSSRYLLHCDFVSDTASSFLSTPAGSNSCESDTSSTTRCIFIDPISVLSTNFTSLANVYVCEQLSYVLLYNLALAHHLRAITEQDLPMRTLRLEKALALYEHAHSVLINSTSSSVSRREEGEEGVLQVSLVHTMAIASNLAHVHSQLGNEAQSRLCLEHLLSTILYIVDCGEGGKLYMLDGFCSIVMPLLASGLPHPAPAA